MHITTHLIIARRALIALAALAASIGASAQTTAADAFASAPQEVFPLLDKTTRLDMIDYFRNGMSTASANKVDGKSRITSLDPASLKVEVSAASDCQLAVLPAASDSLVALIVTVKSPAPDSRIDFFNSKWMREPDNAHFTKPSMEQWLTPEGKKNAADVSAFVPFLLVSYNYDPQQGLLTLTNNTKDFLSADIYAMVADYLKPQLVFKWNGKRFVPNQK